MLSEKKIVSHSTDKHRPLTCLLDPSSSIKEMHLPIAACSGCTLGAPGDETALEIILAWARHSSGRREQQPVLSFDQGWSGRWVTHKLAASSLELWSGNGW